VRNEVGKTKRSTFNLPPIEHVYGKEPKKDKENAKEGRRINGVLMSEK